MSTTMQPWSTSAKQAVAAARAGADVFAPSAAMDGQVQAIRRALDDAGFTHIPIMAYSTKFASALYGPFREAGGSALKGDRKSYQMNPMNRREAVRESLLDEQEGADALMVKPAGAYLDIIRDIREASRLPVAAYQVSGEYAMIKIRRPGGRWQTSAYRFFGVSALRKRQVQPQPRKGRRKAAPQPILNPWRFDHCAAKYIGQQAIHHEHRKRHPHEDSTQHQHLQGRRSAARRDEWGRKARKKIVSLGLRMFINSPRNIRLRALDSVGVSLTAKPSGPPGGV
ncbi:delta-aminolevulinic acid dehydratase domain-containing protein [Ditylenchus destructor]|nr:delta-aminolevulinic acid dehydratase domain-containing protein [Ditylenchus destructor]